MLVTAGCFLPTVVRAAASSCVIDERRLNIYNEHTGERLDACYRRNGNYDPGALDAINHVLRDHRTGDVKAIDVHL